MEDTLLINQIDQAKALFKPIRIDILKLLTEPRTCPELGEVFSASPQKIYYHIKALEKAGLVVKVREERVRGIMQGYYQAAANSYWLSPGMVAELGGTKQTQDQMSLSYLLALAGDIQKDVAALIQSKDQTPTLGVSAQIELADQDQRAAFMTELQETLQALAQKYGRKDIDDEIQAGQVFQLALAAYPQPPAE